MSIFTKFLTLLFGVIGGLSVSHSASAQDALPPILIGDLNNYSLGENALKSYENGYQLAIDQINASGGINGRRLEVLKRDTAGRKEIALRQAKNLSLEHHVSFLTGGESEDIVLALSNFANQNNLIYFSSLSTSSDLIWRNGTKYSFNLRPTIQTHIAILANIASKMEAKSWSVIAPRNRYGEFAAELFYEYLQQLDNDLTLNPPIWISQSETFFSAPLQEIQNQKSEALLNLLNTEDNLLNFLRQGQDKHLFENKAVLSPFLGNPEYRLSLGTLIPENWIVTGYPIENIKIPSHKDFLAAYQKKYQTLPTQNALLGYSMIRAIARAVESSSSLQTSALISSLRGLSFSSPLGPVKIRSADQQSTIGTFVGLISHKNNTSYMSNIQFVPVEKYMPRENFTSEYLRRKKAR